MKTNFAIVINAIILSILLGISCGNKETQDEQVKNLMDHLIECTQIFESCKEDCKPTPEQTEVFEDCVHKCLLDPTQGGIFDQFSLDCYRWCENNLYGNWAQKECENKCVEKYYECIFGEDWKDLNLKKPEDFKNN